MTTDHDHEGITTMTTKKVTVKDAAAAIAMLDRERKSTGYVTEMRRCTGSERFGIEPHEAPVSTFPVQPSRKDGLGTMCTEHWKAYVKGLREARLETASAPKATTGKAPVAQTRTRKAATPSVEAEEVATAEALIEEVDALPASEMVRRVGDTDVQAALEASAMGRMLAD